MTAEAVAPRPIAPGQAQQQDLRIAALGAPHLADYLRDLTARGIAEPQYFSEITRKTAPGGKQRNLIYRVDDDIFVHILTDEEDARDSYISIDPACRRTSPSTSRRSSPASSTTSTSSRRRRPTTTSAEVLLKAVEENIKVSDAKNTGEGARKTRRARARASWTSPSRPTSTTRSST